MRICRAVVDGMIEHSLQEYPLESCGLLSGHEGMIDGITPSPNELESPRAFRIPAAVLFAFVRNTRQGNRQFLGIYHSHPEGPEEPSQRDRDEYCYPGVSYWVVSGLRENPRVRCFRWSEGRFLGVPFETVIQGQGERGIAR